MMFLSFTLTSIVVTGIDQNLAVYAKSNGVYFIFDHVSWPKFGRCH